jgi:hypothetical protein
MDSRLLSHDPETGVSEFIHYDEATDDIVLELYQELDLDASNAAEYNAHSDHGPTRWKGDWHRVASIPLVELERLKREGRIDQDGTVRDDKSLIKLLNDRDYLKFRTKPGRL